MFLSSAAKTRTLRALFMRSPPSAFRTPRLTFAAAAAVGSLSGMAYHLEEIRSFYMSGSSWNGSPSWHLRDPLAASASTGKAHVVEYFLPLVERWVRDYGSDLGSGALMTHMYAAITAAIKAKNAEIIMMLCKFLKKQGWTIDQEFRDYSAAPVLVLEEWLKAAATSGCMKTCRTVAHILLELHQRPALRAVEQLFDFACQKGQTHLVRAMLDKKQLVYQSGDFCQPHHQAPYEDSRAVYRRRWSSLHIAAKYGHKELIDILMEYGADVNRFDEPILETIKHGHFMTMTHMLDRGARITALTTRRLSALLKAMQYNGIRSFDCKYRLQTFYVAAKIGAPYLPS